MGADLDFLQGAVILAFAMIPALLHGARDGLVRLAVVLHFSPSFILGSSLVSPKKDGI